MSDPTPERDTVRPDPSAGRPHVERDRAAATPAPAAPAPAATSTAPAAPGAPTPASASGAPATRQMPAPANGRPGERRPDQPDGEAAQRGPAPRETTARRETAQRGAAADGGAATAWAHLQSQFVDDPAAAVRGASDLVEQAVQQLLRRSGDHDTEELRTAFLRYRDLHRTLTSL